MAHVSVCFPYLSPSVCVCRLVTVHPSVNGCKRPSGLWTECARPDPVPRVLAGLCSCLLSKLWAGARCGHPLRLPPYSSSPPPPSSVVFPPNAPSRDYKLAHRPPIQQNLRLYTTFHPPPVPRPCSKYMQRCPAGSFASLRSLPRLTTLAALPCCPCCACCCPLVRALTTLVSLLLQPTLESREPAAQPKSPSTPTIGLVFPFLFWISPQLLPPTALHSALPTT